MLSSRARARSYPRQSIVWGWGTHYSDMALVFPETSGLVRKRPPPTQLTLGRLLLVVYMFGGISALISLVSKLILQPLFHQLVEDRRAYASQALNRLMKLNASLSCSVSYIPPSKSIAQHYVDQQVQTDVDPKRNPYSMGSIVSAESDSIEVNQLLESMRRLNSAMELETNMPLKNDLNELSSYVQSLTYPSSMSSFSGLGRIGGIADSSPGSKKQRPDVVGQFKKEIRSVKGSLLSMRR